MRMPVCPVARKVEARPACAHLAVDAERGVHLADRAVGADRQHPLAAALYAVRDRIGDRRYPHVVQPPSGRGRDGGKVGFVAKEVVQPARQIEALFQRGHQHLFPGRGNHAAAVRDADHHRAAAGGLCLGQCHVGQAHVCVAAGHAELAQRMIRSPVPDALCHLRGQRIGGVAEKQQIGGLDHRKAPGQVAAGQCRSAGMMSCMKMACPAARAAMRRPLTNCRKTRQRAAARGRFGGRARTGYPCCQGKGGPRQRQGGCAPRACGPGRRCRVIRRPSRGPRYRAFG